MRKFSGVLCILILGILFIGCSSKSESSIDERTEKIKPSTNYTVENFELVNRDDKTIRIHFKDKDLASIQVNFDKVDIDGYYCIVGNSIANENTLAGKRQIETQDMHKIRLSEDLEKEIMKELH